nr:hypothetical protein [Pseudomonadota bacterium]
MRVFSLVVVLACLCGCASDKLALAPPPGVDLSGHWELNEADSDDPQRLVLSQMAGPRTPEAGSPDEGGQGRGGGRDGRGGGGGPRGGGGPGGGMGGGFPAAGPPGPSLPALGALSEGLRWPGSDVEIKQVAGVIAMSSAGIAEVYQPVAATTRRFHREQPGEGPFQGRDMPARDRGGPPPVCGWDDKTLVIQSGAADDDHPPFVERYSLSPDGQRLIEVLGFKGGRAAGFTMSRVWDRAGAAGPHVQ